MAIGSLYLAGALLLAQLLPAPADDTPAQFSTGDNVLLGLEVLAAAHIMLVLPATWLAGTEAARRWQWLLRLAPALVVMGIVLVTLGAPLDASLPVILILIGLLAGVPVLLMSMAAAWLCRGVPPTTG